MKQASYNYIYDGSFFGFLNCFYHALKDGEVPVGVITEPYSLVPLRHIESDTKIAESMIKGVKNRICPDAYQALKLLYLSCQEDRELVGIKFLSLAFRVGRKAMEMVSDVSVTPFIKAVKLVDLEAHRFIQFIRFSEHNGVLISVIEPQNNVLPLLVEHFTSRFATIDFLIYDKTHSLALIYENGKTKIIPLLDYELPEFDADELKYRNLFREFYDTVAIKERRNERCRNNFMPKKYWKNMTEFMKD